MNSEFCQPNTECLRLCPLVWDRESEKAAAHKLSEELTDERESTILDSNLSLGEKILETHAQTDYQEAIEARARVAQQEIITLTAQCEGPTVRNIVYENRCNSQSRINNYIVQQKQGTGE